MPSLKERRQALEADLQQLVGQINRTQGAMALLDELIRIEGQEPNWSASEIEIMKKQRAAYLAAQQEQTAYQSSNFEPAPAANDEPAPHKRTCNCGECGPYPINEPETLGVILSSRVPQPEMLPVMRELEFPF